MIYLFQVLELIACDCIRKCSVGSCSCIELGMKCTDACKVTNCDNMVDENSKSDQEDDDVIYDNLEGSDGEAL